MLIKLETCSVRASLFREQRKHNPEMECLKTQWYRAKFIILSMNNANASKNSEVELKSRPETDVTEVNR